MKSTRIEARFERGKGFSLQASSDDRSTAGLAWQLGFYATTVLAVMGVLYFLLITGLLVTGNLSLPPSGTVQMIGGIMTILMAPLLVVLVASLHALAPLEKKILSQVGLVFTALFAMAVSMNRFVQLSVVRQGFLHGQTEGLARFLPYEASSVMFAMEILGWSFFLSLAALFLAPLFTVGKLERWIGALFLAYGVIGLASALGFVLEIQFLGAMGFVAWGFVLPVINILLIPYFRQLKSS